MTKSSTEEMDKDESNDMSELPEAEERRSPLDQEISALLNRVRFLDLTLTPRFVDRVDSPNEEISKSAEEDPRCLVTETGETGELEGCFLQTETAEVETKEGDSLVESARDEEIQTLHPRCYQVTESIECQLSQLRPKLHAPEHEHEDLVERNEVLESLLGEMQSQSRAEREQLECQVDSLQRKISHLEAELCHVQKINLDKMDGEMAREVADCQEKLKIHQGNIEMLESKLLKEAEQRKQLARDLEATQKALKDEKKELHNSKSELLRLYGEIQVLRGAAEERDFLHMTHEKLWQEKLVLENQVSELSQKCEQLNQLFIEEQKSKERFWTNRKTAQDDPLDKCPHSPGEEREQLGLKLLESSRKIEELEKQIRDSYQEKNLLWEENTQLKNDILALEHQLSTHSPATGRAKHEAGLGENPPPMTQTSKGGTEGDAKQGPPGEKRLQQQEELQQLQHDVRRVQDLCRSTEKELRDEREKNLELKKHNLSLQQENLKNELSHQKVQELELQLMKQSREAKQQSGLRETLALEKARRAKAEERIVELQQKLKECQHQMQLLQGKQIEEDVKEAREKETEAQQQFQEEQQKRKLLDRQAEALKQQLILAREKEGQLTRTCTELQVQSQQLEVQLQVLEEEKKTLSNEHLHCQKHSQKLSEQLLALQQETKALHKEYMFLLEQVDISIRKHNERKLRHKAKLRRAKETFISEMKQRDVRIKHLENEIQLSKTQREKNQALIKRMSAENERLLQKKMKLSQQLLDLEEADRSHRQAIFVMQTRMHFLDEENKQLQDRILQLTGQVGILERALKNCHNHSLEELKSIGFSECPLQSQMLSLPNLSLLATGHLDSCSLPKAMKDRKEEDSGGKTLLSPSPFQSSEIGYLNVASPAEPASAPKDNPPQLFCCDQVKAAREEFPKGKQTERLPKELSYCC